MSPHMDLGDTTAEPICRRVFLASLALIGFCFAAIFSPVQSQVKPEPNHSAIFDWRIITPPASQLRSATFSTGGIVGAAVGERGVILWTEDKGRRWQRANVPSDVQTDLKSVALIESYGVAVGDSGAILLTSDHAKSWMEATPPQLQKSVDLTAVALTEAYGVAVGDAGTVLRTEDRGKTWARARTPQESDSKLSAVVLSGNHGIAVGDSGMILWTSNAGQDWSKAFLPSGFDSFLGPALSAVVVKGNQAIAVGENGTVLWSDNTGQSWTRGTTPSGGSSIRAVALDGNHGVAVGEGETILWTADAGKSWSGGAISQRSSIDTSRSTFTAVMIANSQGVAIGEGGLVAWTEDGGKNWKRGSAFPKTEVDFEALAIGESLVAVGEKESIWRTVDWKNWLRAETPKLDDADFTAMAISGANGVAVGGAIVVWTDDSGKTWKQPATIPGAKPDLMGVSLAGTRAVIFGRPKTILWSDDAGEHWTAAKMPTNFDGRLTSVALDGLRGIGIDNSGILLWTDDGGKEWHFARVPSRIDVSFRAVSLSKDFGIAVGEEGIILYTANGGKDWVQATAPASNDPLLTAAIIDTRAIATSRRQVLQSVDSGKTWAQVPASLDPRATLTGISITGTHGVAYGTRGTMLWTADAGKTWIPAVSPLQGQTTSVRRVVLSGDTGVAITSSSLILKSRDAGKTWRAYTKPRVLSGVSLVTVAIGSPSGPVFIGGRNGLLVRGEASRIAPYLGNHDRSVRQRLDGQIELDLQVANDTDNRVQNIFLEYSVDQGDKSGGWNPVPGTLSKSANIWQVSWSPRESRISDGSTIRHRARLDDGDTPLAAIPLNSVIYNSLWRALQEKPGVLWTVSTIVLLVGAYVVTLSLLFWIAPARLALASSQTLEAMGEVAGSGSNWARTIIKLVNQITLPWLKRQPRVRIAWLEAYQLRKSSFRELDENVLLRFLDQADVLDAWVARRLSVARKSLDQLPLYRARRTYIPFPVRLSDAAGNEMIDQPVPATFAKIFLYKRIILPIVGGGGSGKTTIACALARWSLAEDSEVRLQPHVSIPVFISEDTEDLLATVKANLERMVGMEEELTPNIVGALLKHKRILVIVDALSERSAQTQKYYNDLLGSGLPIGALIVTTRREPDWGAVEHTLLEPQPIKLQLLVSFIIEYIQRRKLIENFSPEEQLALAQRILQIVKIGGGLTVTPLLVTLFVDAVVSRRLTATAVDTLPVDVPEIYLDYLKRLNPVDTTTPDKIDHEMMLKAALILGRTSLGDEFVPTDFRRKDAEIELNKAGFVPPKPFIDKLISNGVIQETSVASVGILRFQLDPIAEYLAAIKICLEMETYKGGCEELFGSLTVAPGYPETFRGFLTALSVCYATYKVRLKLPALEFPWADPAQNSEGT